MTPEELKEKIDWHRGVIGPRNADKFKADIDSLVGSLVPVWDNMTEEQIAFVKELCIQTHKDMKDETHEDDEEGMLNLCGWEVFCENLGIEGHNFS